MYATDVIGYAFDADIHCEDCTRKRFPDADSEFSDVQDSEGNEVHAVFAGDEHESTVHCGDCGAELYEVDEPEDDDEPTEPQEDDITTEDHENFYQDGHKVLKNAGGNFWHYFNGRIWLHLGPFDTCEQAVRAYMDKTQYWPNVWFISDHGNAHLMNVNE